MGKKKLGVTVRMKLKRDKGMSECHPYPSSLDYPMPLPASLLGDS